MVQRPYELALLSFLLANPVAAQDALPEEVTRGFYVTVEEVRANSREIFQVIAGTDGGPISEQRFMAADLSELPGAAAEDGTLRRRLFDLLDGNDDGQLTYAEWERQIERDLLFADSNGDGRITLRELANARENMGIGDALNMIFQ